MYIVVIIYYYNYGVSMVNRYTRACTHTHHTHTHTRGRRTPFSSSLQLSVLDSSFISSFHPRMILLSIRSLHPLDPPPPPPSPSPLSRILFHPLQVRSEFAGEKAYSVWIGSMDVVTPKRDLRRRCAHSVWVVCLLSALAYNLDQTINLQWHVDTCCDDVFIGTDTQLAQTMISPFFSFAPSLQNLADSIPDF
jgi:hypothetical protein